MEKFTHKPHPRLIVMNYDKFFMMKEFLFVFYQKDSRICLNESRKKFVLFVFSCGKKRKTQFSENIKIIYYNP